MKNRIKELVEKIFSIIPSYYDKYEAEKIEKLISEFIEENKKEEKDGSIH